MIAYKGGIFCKKHLLIIGTRKLIQNFAFVGQAPESCSYKEKK
jgi:hypothetical protein